MAEETTTDDTNKFQQIESRVNQILTTDSGVKTNYSDLRNLYSVISNDIRATTAKKLEKTISWAKTIISENLKTRHPKKETSLYEVEGKLNELLDSAPDLNPQNTQEGFQYLRECLPHLAKSKANLAKRLATEKKEKKIRQLEAQLDNVHGISTQMYQLYNFLVHYSYFDQYLFLLIKAKFNKDDINSCVSVIHVVIKEIFKYPKDGDFDVNNYAIIDPLTRWIHLKLDLYTACDYQKTFSEILKRLPRLLVQQFNTRYFAKRRDATKNIVKLKESKEYKVMTKKFITLKLQKFYELLRAYTDHMGRLFAINDELIKQISVFADEMADKTNIGNRRFLIKEIETELDRKRSTFQKIVDSLPKNEDIRKNNIKVLNSYILNFYYNVLNDAYHPQSMQDLASYYMKKGAVSKELVLNPKELAFLSSSSFKRNEKILRLFYQGIMELVKGEQSERPVIKPVMLALNKEYNRNQKEEMWERTVNTFLKEISPDEINIFIDIMKSLPNDKERVNTPIGRLYQEIVEKYPNQAKKKVNQAEKIKPTDPPEVKIKKIVSEKLDRLILKEAGPKIGALPVTELLKNRKEEEIQTIKTEEERTEMMAAYYLSKLIANWKVETEKAIIDLCMGGASSSKMSPKSPGVSRHEMKYINEYFNSEYLIEIEKHLKILTESIGRDYLSNQKPYNKIEYAMLFATRNLMMDYENPAKSYPRTYERLTAISGKTN